MPDIKNSSVSMVGQKLGGPKEGPGVFSSKGQQNAVSLAVRA